MSKLDTLIDWFSDKNRVIIALSGGVDSALVAYAAYQRLGDSALAVTADYKTLSTEELESAKKISHEIGIRQILLDYNELLNENFVKNDSNRCFHCRAELGDHLVKVSTDFNASCIVDGTNLDDTEDFRPGITALRQNGIQSPLLETNFTKNEVRYFAKSVGLSVYDKPSNSCLASRIPWGQRVTAEKLTRIELSEKFVKEITMIQQVRVRDMNGIAKIEVEKENIPILHNKTKFKQIFEQFILLGFKDVKIDAEGYVSGKINVMTD